MSLEAMSNVQRIQLLQGMEPRDLCYLVGGDKDPETLNDLMIICRIVKSRFLRASFFNRLIKNGIYGSTIHKGVECVSCGDRKSFFDEVVKGRVTQEGIEDAVLHHGERWRCWQKYKLFVIKE